MGVYRMAYQLVEYDSGKFKLLSFLFPLAADGQNTLHRGLYRMQYGESSDSGLYCKRLEICGLVRLAYCCPVRLSDGNKIQAEISVLI